MLFDARGNPIAVTDPRQDLRTKEQKRFDDEFRKSMESGGGVYAKLAERVKNQMARRDTAKELGLHPGLLVPMSSLPTKVSYMQEVGDAVKEASDHNKKHVENVDFGRSKPALTTSPTTTIPDKKE